MTTYKYSIKNEQIWKEIFLQAARRRRGCWAQYLFDKNNGHNQDWVDRQKAIWKESRNHYYSLVELYNNLLKKESEK